MLRLSFHNRINADSSSDMKNLIKILLIFLGLIVFAAIISKGVFLQPKNLLNLTFQNVILILVALAQMLVIITGGIDLSVGSILSLSTVIIVLCQDFGLGTALLTAICSSAVLGAVNGALVTFRRLPSFVVTLAMMQIGASIAQVIGGGAAVYSGKNGAEISQFLITFYKKSLMGIPYPIIVWIAALIVIGLFLKTSLGHFAYAVGGNEKSALLSGIPVKLVKTLVYVLAAVLSCLAAALYVARVGEGNPQAGTWFPLDSIAAVTIGGASLTGGVGTVAGTFIGVLILGILNNIMNLLNVSPSIQPAVKGLVILLAVYLNSQRKQN